MIPRHHRYGGVECAFCHKELKVQKQQLDRNKYFYCREHISICLRKCSCGKFIMSDKRTTIANHRKLGHNTSSIRYDINRKRMYVKVEDK